VLRVVVIDDHSTFSELLSRALDSEPDVVCVGTAASAETGEALVHATRPDAVVMDVQLGRGDGLELTARLSAVYPELRIIVLTAHTDTTLVQRAAGAGACALMPKDGLLDEVLTALRGAPRGGLSVHPQMLRSLVTVPAQREQVAALTDREVDVLRLLNQGRSAREIAAALFISEHTVRGHIKKVLMKLDAHSQLEAVAIAHRRGLLT